MVWWNAVSKTATCFTSGNNALHAKIACKFAGLCKGAKSLHSSILAITSSVIITGCWKYSPPCTTLCPIASNSNFPSTETFGKIEWSASVWFLISQPFSQMCSTFHFATTTFFSISKSWYFNDELHALRTKIFMRIKKNKKSYLYNVSIWDLNSANVLVK